MEVREYDRTASAYVPLYEGTFWDWEARGVTGCTD
jgi:hypothetical protein